MVRVVVMCKKSHAPGDDGFNYFYSHDSVGTYGNGAEKQVPWPNNTHGAYGSTPLPYQPDKSHDICPTGKKAIEISNQFILTRTTSTNEWLRKCIMDVGTKALEAMRFQEKDMSDRTEKKFEDMTTTFQKELEGIPNKILNQQGFKDLAEQNRILQEEVKKLHLRITILEEKLDKKQDKKPDNQ